MNADDMVRAIGILSQTYGGHTWIDFDIVPGIAVALLEEFDHLDREAVLFALDADPPDGWSSKAAGRVRTHFGPRCFVVVQRDGVRRYWNSNTRGLVDRFEDAIRFDDEKEAFEISDREQGPLGGKNPDYEGAVVTIERVEYPEWTRCENPP
jgi:hypothetical protein